MMTLTRSLFVARRSLALCAVLGAGSVAAVAQQATVSTTAAATPSIKFSAPMEQATAETYSSSSSENQLAMSENPFDVFVKRDAAQPPPRRSYGRPRYRGGNTNADGSDKYEFYVGGGATFATGPMHRIDNTSYSFQVGGGRNFNKNVGVMAEFNWDNFGLKGSTIRQQEIIYDPVTDSFNGYLDGYSHVWSFSVDPVYNIAVNEGLGAYLIGGPGFYHKITTFTVPTTGVYCDYYYGCYQYSANSPIDNYTSNSFGLNGGLGFTYKMSRFSNVRLYAEARYVYTFDKYRAGISGKNFGAYAPAYNYPTNNLFPANSQRSSYVPVKFGVRF